MGLTEHSRPGVADEEIEQEAGYLRLVVSHRAACVVIVMWAMLRRPPCGVEPLLDGDVLQAGVV